MEYVMPEESRSRVRAVRHGSASITVVAREFEVDVRVESKTLCAEGVVALELGRVDLGPLPKWEPGAHVDLLIEGVATRQYSLCGDPNDRKRWTLAILR